MKIFSLSQALLGYHYGFYLLFNVVLSKEKFKLGIAGITVSAHPRAV